MNERTRLMTDFVYNAPWLITEAGLRALAASLEDGAARSPEPEGERAERLAAASVNEAAKTLNKTEDGIAVIPVRGPLVGALTLWQMIAGGATLTGALRNRIAAAADAPDVSAIVLDINSPGGQVTGIAETGAEIARAAERKPVIAYAGGMCASAAYWLASQATEIVADPTAELGSIGVVVEWADTRGFWEQLGVRFHTFVSSRAPRKRIDVRSDNGLARLEITGLLDKLEEQFYQAVAAGRDVTTEKIARDFGQGGVMIAADAIRAGMADRTGFFGEALAAARKRRRSYGMSGLRAAAPEPSDQSAPGAPPEASTSTENPPTSGSAATVEESMSLIEKIQKALGLERADAEAAIRTAAAEIAPAAAEAAHSQAELEAERQRREAAEQALAAARSRTRELMIQATYTELHIGACIAPAQEARFRELAAQMLDDDHAHPLATGSRFDALRELLRAAPRHDMFAEQVEGARALNPDPADDEAAAEAHTADQYADVLRQTPLGRRALALVENKGA